MARQFLLPDIGEGLTEAEVVRWHVAVGDTVTVDQVLCEVETDKAVVELPSPYPGTVLRLGAAEGEVVRVGEVVVVIGEPGELEEPPAGDAGDAGAAEVSPRTAPSSPPARMAKAMPAVRKLARELGVDLDRVAGSGPDGQITRADVERAAESGTAALAGVKMSRLRRTIASNLTRSWQEIPHVTTFDDVVADSLLEVRRTLARRLGAAVPLEALLVRAVLPALREHPELNAAVEGDRLITFDHYDIGVAVDTPGGLIVPVVRGAGALSPGDLSRRILELAEAARARSLTPDDLGEQTFTLSNIGALGGRHGTPIIPLGTTSILSVGKAEARPAVESGSVVVRSVMPLSLSYDHRAVDGALGRRFIDRVIAAIADPEQLLE